MPSRLKTRMTEHVQADLPKGSAFFFEKLPDL